MCAGEMIIEELEPAIGLRPSFRRVEDSLCLQNPNDLWHAGCNPATVRRAATLHHKRLGV